MQRSLWTSDLTTYVLIPAIPLFYICTFWKYSSYLKLHVVQPRPLWCLKPTMLLYLNLCCRYRRTTVSGSHMSKTACWDICAKHTELINVYLWCKQAFGFYSFMQKRQYQFKIYKRSKSLGTMKPIISVRRKPEVLTDKNMWVWEWMLRLLSCTDKKIIFLYILISLADMQSFRSFLLTVKSY